MSAVNDDSILHCSNTRTLLSTPWLQKLVRHRCKTSRLLLRVHVWGIKSWV